MAIGKRFIDLARSELNSLLDRAARLGEDEAEDDGSRRRDDPLAALSDEELEAELERRRLDREIEERARRAQQKPSGRSAGTSSGTGQSRSGTGRAAGFGTAPPAGDLNRAYAALEVPPGSDFDTVRKAYRTLMRKYHPDRHAGSPEKQKAANELAQRLTESYKLLEKRLRK